MVVGDLFLFKPLVPRPLRPSIININNDTGGCNAITHAHLFLSFARHARSILWMYDNDNTSGTDPSFELQDKLVVFTRSPETNYVLGALTSVSANFKRERARAFKTNVDANLMMGVRVGHDHQQQQQHAVCGNGTWVCDCESSSETVGVFESYDLSFLDVESSPRDQVIVIEHFRDALAFMKGISSHK